MNRNSILVRLVTFTFVFALAFSALLVGCGSQSPSATATSSAASSSANSASAAAGEVAFTMTIDASEAGEGMLYDQKATAKEGATVYQALVDTGLPLEVDSSSGSVFVSGIGKAIANDGKAGWMFSVNGKMPNVGADKATIADGDVIEWKYYKDASKAL